MTALINRLDRNPESKAPGPKRTHSAANEWLATLAFSGLVIFLDRLSTNLPSTYPVIRTVAGLLYLIAIVYIACRVGMKSAFACCGLLVIYVWIITHMPVSAFGREPGKAFVFDATKAARSVITTGIIYPLFAIIAGIVQTRLRDAATRESDAREAASAASEQRRIAEAELWASEEMRKLIVDSSIDAVIGMTEEGVITLWNPNAERLFGWTQTDAIGAYIGERIATARSAGPQKPDLLSFLKSDIGSILRRQIEFVVLTKAKKEVSVELYIAEQRTEAGSIYILFVRDISDRKRAELAIQELNSRLEDRVAKRTEQLEAANSELVGFTYSVSHDLRAPLRAIVSNSRIVREEAQGILDEQTFGRLQRLESNALKMAELIENLLQFARIGQVAINKQPVDLTAIAHEIESDLKAKREGTVTIQPGMTVLGDPEMIKMMMFNLMENAWKYVRPDQDPVVSVGRTPEGVFYVRDNGIGFDMKYAEKVWEPFERLHRDSEYPGTGIGLANSKRIVVRHGGKLWTESALGEGTTMFFELENDSPLSASKSFGTYVS